MQRILTEDVMMMKWVAAKLVPCLLTEEQKSNHVNVCCDLQEELKNGRPSVSHKSCNR